jgi:hypothetical protein
MAKKQEAGIVPVLFYYGNIYGIVFHSPVEWFCG